MLPLMTFAFDFPVLRWRDSCCFAGQPPLHQPSSGLLQETLVYFYLCQYSPRTPWCWCCQQYHSASLPMGMVLRARTGQETLGQCLSTGSSFQSTAPRALVWAPVGWQTLHEGTAIGAAGHEIWLSRPCLPCYNLSQFPDHSATGAGATTQSLLRYQ